MNTNVNQTIIVPLDMDTAIQYATEDYISSLDLTQEYSIDELKAGVLESIHSKFDEHNVISEKGNKWSYPKSLPNACVADLIRFQHDVKSISWNGKKDEYNYIAVYQESGEQEGIYVGNDAYFSKLIRQYKYGATRNDIDEVKSILMADSEFVTPNSNRDLIAVNNGIFDYRTKKLMPFSPDYVFTAKSRVNYVPNAVNPHYTMHDGLDWDVDTWFETLSDDPEVTQLLWEVVGAIIRPHVRWDKIVCFYSQKGMNGKGTLCELMKQLCGEGTYASIPFDAFERDFKLVDLVTATAVITDENGTTDFTRSPATLKALTTGDDAMIDRKYRDPIKIKFSGLILECINSLPRISDTTDSLYRRFLIVPFEKTFQGVERKYIKSDYLHRQEVLEYVLCKVLNTDYYTLSEPVACQEMLDEYKEYNDPVRAFWNDIKDDLAWDFYPNDFLFDLFSAWADRHKMGRNNCQATFLKTLENIVPDDGWMRMKKKTRITKKRNGKPEFLIREYHLDDWTYKGYVGSNHDLLYCPTFNKANYYGFIRCGVAFEEDEEQ